jgi:threonine/homoserine/homoserine lactone efflux protein
MDHSALLVFAFALGIAAGSPGPSIAALCARVVARGYRSVIPFLAAMWIGEAIWLSLAVFGLAYIAEAFHWAFSILKYCGVIYLLCLAYKMWTAPPEVHEGNLPNDPPVRLFFAGMAVTLGNPKIMMFYLALLPSIIDLAQVSIIGWVELTITMLLVLIAVDLVWVAMAAQARCWLKSPVTVRLANRICAGALGGAAVTIAAK